MHGCAAVMLKMLCVCFALLRVCQAMSDYHHMQADQHKLQPGWQEPGLWRPRWVMDRVFQTERDGEMVEEKRDRIYFKMKADRTMKIYKQSSRPRFEWFKPITEATRKKKLFETGKERFRSVEEQFRSQDKDQEQLFQIDGAWNWEDAAPLEGAKVQLESREELPHMEEEGKQEQGGRGMLARMREAVGLPAAAGADSDSSGRKREKILHEAQATWGALDGYAAKFRRGKMVKYKVTPEGVPLGTTPAGFFKIRVCTHRPILGKDFCLP